jgi:hypothetical protein
MLMVEPVRRGNLSQTPFARLLAELWKDEATGTLAVRRPGGRKVFSFENGGLVLDRATLPEKDFLQSLLTSGATDLINLARVEDHAQRNGAGVVRALLELRLLEPGRLWALMEGFVKEDTYPLFDLEDGEFEFSPGASPGGRVYIRNIFVPSIILEGVRRMANEDLIARSLPPESETVQSLDPYFLDLMELAPHEKYLLDALGSPRPLAELLETSELGRRETARLLFVFFSLGLAGTRTPKPKTGRLPVEMSLADMDKVFGLFNAKCSYIFKYISKEIGPVALSVIGNSLEDVRSRLDPAFQGLELKADGRIELKTFLKTSMNLISDDSRRSLLRSMDEILVAEVLAVKRTLGSSHESVLVKSLERIGEPS